jgi:hypothetical protein
VNKQTINKKCVKNSVYDILGAGFHFCVYSNNSLHRETRLVCTGQRGSSAHVLLRRCIQMFMCLCNGQKTSAPYVGAAYFWVWLRAQTEACSAWDCCVMRLFVESTVQFPAGHPIKCHAVMFRQFNDASVSCETQLFIFHVSAFVMETVNSCFLLFVMQFVFFFCLVPGLFNESVPTAELFFFA